MQNALYFVNIVAYFLETILSYAYSLIFVSLQLLIAPTDNMCRVRGVVLYLSGSSAISAIYESGVIHVYGVNYFIILAYL